MREKSLFLGIISVLIFFFVAAQGSRPSSKLDLSSRVSNEAVVELKEVNGSGQTGKVVLYEIGGRTAVLVDISVPAPGAIQGVFVQEGTCRQLGPIRYYIAPTVAGKSATTWYEVSFSRLKNEFPLAIVVKKTDKVEDRDKNVLCAELRLPVD